MRRFKQHVLFAEGSSYSSERVDNHLESSKRVYGGYDLVPPLSKTLGEIRQLTCLVCESQVI